MLKSKKPCCESRVFLNMVGEIGFEPTTHWSQTSCATKLRYSPKAGWILLPERLNVKSRNRNFLFFAPLFLFRRFISQISVFYPLIGKRYVFYLLSEC